ncbi:mannonate dehydratase, partial [Planctomycetota bacterium]
MKLALGVHDLSEETLSFAAQLGVTHVKVGADLFMAENKRGVIDRDQLVEAIRTLAGYGLEIGVMLLPQAQETQNWNIRLGTPEREHEIKDVCRTIDIVGGEGVPVIEYVFNLLGNWRPAPVPRGRGKAHVSWFSREVAEKAPEGSAFAATEEDVWSRIAWFLERAVPAAERSGVRLACHPDDPPVPYLRGETRVLCRLDGLKRLIETVPSEANGLNFCQGTIAEMGEDVIEAIRYFG